MSKQEKPNPEVLENIGLVHFSPMFYFCTLENVRKPKVFLTFLGGIEMKHCAKLKWVTLKKIIQNFQNLQNFREKHLWTAIIS